jgi:hypothetical protein
MAFRSSNQQSGNAASLTVTAPSGIVAGDILLAFWSQGGAANATITWPSGFTQLDTANSAVHDVTTKVAWKLATGSEPASYQIDTTVGDLCVAIVAAWSGRANTAPTSADTVQNTTAPQPITVTLTGVTAANGDDIAWFGARCSGAGTNGTWTAPSSYTERQDVQATTYISASLATRDAVSAGATGDISGTLVGGDDAGYAGFVIAIAAAAAGSSIAAISSNYLRMSNN